MDSNTGLSTDLSTDLAPSLLWFRQDLRLNDNPALKAALKTGRVIPVYVLDDDSPGDWQRGAASRCWLHHSLARLDESLHNRLWVLKGNAATVIPTLAKKLGAKPSSGIAATSLGA